MDLRIWRGHFYFMGGSVVDYMTGHEIKVPQPERKYICENEDLFELFQVLPYVLGDDVFMLLGRA